MYVFYYEDNILELFSMTKFLLLMVTLNYEVICTIHYVFILFNCIHRSITIENYGDNFILLELVTFIIT